MSLSAAKIADIGKAQADALARREDKQQRKGKAGPPRVRKHQAAAAAATARPKGEKIGRYIDGAAALHELDLSTRGLTDIGELNFFTELQRIDLSDNALAGLEGIAANLDLDWLKVSGNSIRSLAPLARLAKLKVLNCSGNALEGALVGVAGLTQLAALILSHNKLTSVDALKKLTKLNTLVLSHNALTKAPPLRGLTELTKLSLSHNAIAQFPSLDEAWQLKVRGRPRE
jgi:Leucine-rich repeat (LRR) protein